MKTIIMVAALIVLLIQSLFAGTNAPPATNSSVAVAQEEGKRLAQTDFTNGVYRLQTYGFQAGKMLPAEEYLKKNYNVGIWPIAQCCVAEEIKAKADAYNSLMKVFLIKKFGKDIFAEAEKATATK